MYLAAYILFKKFFPLFCLTFSYFKVIQFITFKIKDAMLSTSESIQDVLPTFSDNLLLSCVLSSWKLNMSRFYILISKFSVKQLVFYWSLSKWIKPWNKICFCFFFFFFRFLKMCNRHFGSVVAQTIRNQKKDQFPLFLIIMGKRSSNEVLNVIQGKVHVIMEVECLVYMIIF